MATSESDAARRFLSLDVGEVSLVGEPANEEEWLVAKNKTGEANMTTQAQQENGGVDVVKQKQAGDPNDPLVVGVLKEVNSIVANIAKLAGTPVDASAAVTDVEKAKDMTLKGFLKAAGMDDEAMKTVEAMAKKSGLDMAMKLVSSPSPEVGNESGKEKPKGKDTAKTQKGGEGEAEPLTLEGLIEVIAKAKSFTPGRVEKLKALKGVLEELIGDVDPPSDRVPPNLPKGTSPSASAITSISKGNEGAAAPAIDVDVITAAVTKAVQPLNDKIAKLEGDLADVKKARPAGAPAEGDTTDKPVQKGKGLWSGML